MNFGDPRLPERFWNKCIPEPNSGCWLWFGATDSHGDGQITRGRRTERKSGTHRYAYEALVGKVPGGLELDHRVCQTPCSLPTSASYAYRCVPDLRWSSTCDAS